MSTTAAVVTVLLAPSGLVIAVTVGIHLYDFLRDVRAAKQVRACAEWEAAAKAAHWVSAYAAQLEEIRGLPTIEPRR